jgi:hypothetical protein
MKSTSTDSGGWDGENRQYGVSTAFQGLDGLPKTARLE